MALLKGSGKIINKNYILIKLYRNKLNYQLSRKQYPTRIMKDYIYILINA